MLGPHILSSALPHVYPSEFLEYRRHRKQEGDLVLLDIFTMASVGPQADVRCFILTPHASALNFVSWGPYHHHSCEMTKEVPD